MTPDKPLILSRPTVTLRLVGDDFGPDVETIYLDGMPLIRRIVDGKVVWVGELPEPLETAGFPGEESP